MRRSGPAFSVMDQRKKRASHSSQRKGRLKIIARKMDSRIPLVFDLWVSRLRQCGHVTVIPYLPNLVTKDLFTERNNNDWLVSRAACVGHACPRNGHSHPATSKELECCRGPVRCLNPRLHSKD